MCPIIGSIATTEPLMKTFTSSSTPGPLVCEGLDLFQRLGQRVAIIGIARQRPYRMEARMKDCAGLMVACAARHRAHITALAIVVKPFRDRRPARQAMKARSSYPAALMVVSFMPSCALTGAGLLKVAQTSDQTWWCRRATGMGRKQPEPFTLKNIPVDQGFQLHQLMPHVDHLDQAGARRSSWSGAGFFGFISRLEIARFLHQQYQTLHL